MAPRTQKNCEWKKKLRVMLEKKIAAISSRLSKETLAKNVAEDRVTALEEEVSGLRECYQRLGDAQDTIHVLKQEVYGKDSAKMEAEQQLKGIDNENRELKHQLAGAEQQFKIALRGGIAERMDNAD